MAGPPIVMFPAAGRLDLPHRHAADGACREPYGRPRPPPL